MADQDHQEHDDTIVKIVASDAAFPLGASGETNIFFTDNFLKVWIRKPHIPGVFEYCLKKGSEVHSVGRTIVMLDFIFTVENGRDCVRIIKRHHVCLSNEIAVETVDLLNAALSA
jgi:hypothetical protein